MKIEKLKIGNTYYLPVRGCPTSYTYGVLVEIVSKNKVILENKKGNSFSCNTDKLHKSPDKAVRGRKAQERVRREMNEMEQKRKKSLVDKEVQKKVKKLGHSIYSTMDHEKYVVIGYAGLPQPRFDTLEELEIWADKELEKLKERKEEILAKKYKYLCVLCKDGHKEYYTIISFSFNKFEIQCKHFKGNREDIADDKILNKEDVKYMRLKIHK